VFFFIASKVIDGKQVNVASGLVLPMSSNDKA